MDTNTRLRWLVIASCVGSKGGTLTCLPRAPFEHLANLYNAPGQPYIGTLLTLLKEVLDKYSMYDEGVSGCMLKCGISDPCKVPPTL